VVLALGIGLSTAADGARLSDLPTDQQQTVGCMLSVASKSAGVVDARIRISDDSSATPSPDHPIRIFLDYSYNPQTKGMPSTVRSQTVDITALLPRKRILFFLGGITSTASPDLNDNNSGLLGIAERWNKECHLNLSIGTL
jgi:hypothetical protein